MINTKDPVREAVLAGCAASNVVTHAQGIRESNLRFSDEEKDAIRSLRENAAFQSLDKGAMDRHDYKYYLSRLTCTPISVCERTATKITRCLSEGLFDENLNWNGNVAAELAESMASSTPDKQGDDKGMYGLGSGADKEEPKGQLDGGTSQKSDHGDHSRTAKKGYMGEDDVEKAKDRAKEAYEATIAALEAKGSKKEMCPDDMNGDDDDKMKKEGEMPDFLKKKDDDEDKMKKEGEMPDFLKKKDDEKAEHCDDMDYPMKKKKEESAAPDQAPKANMAPSPTNDGNTAATDATYKNGMKQNETVEEMDARHKAERTALENTHDEKSGSTTADPVVSTPGTGSHGSKTEPSEKGGEADKHDPNYEKAKEQDPSNDPKNKGPADAKNESFEDAEKAIIETLQEKGFKQGTQAWDRAYRRGCDMWLTEHATQVSTIQE